MISLDPCFWIIAVDHNRNLHHLPLVLKILTDFPKLLPFVCISSHLTHCENAPLVLRFLRESVWPCSIPAVSVTSSELWLHIFVKCLPLPSPISCNKKIKQWCLFSAISWSSSYFPSVKTVSLDCLQKNFVFITRFAEAEAEHPQCFINALILLSKTAGTKQLLILRKKK